MLKQYSSVQTSPETRFTRVIINNMRLHQSKVCVWLQPVNVFRNLLHIYRDLQIDMHQSDEPTGPTITWEMILGMCCCDTWEPVTRMRKPISFFSFHCQMHRHQTMCHRAEPHRPDRERMERWRRSGGRVRHTNVNSFLHMNTMDDELQGMMGTWGARHGRHAAARQFRDTNTALRHNISTEPRLEKHAAPFWVSLLAAWVREGKKGRKEGKERRVKVKAPVTPEVTGSGESGRTCSSALCQSGHFHH